MSNNGTDRDVALQLLDAVNTAANLVTTINQHLYVATITTQPTDQSGEAGATVTLTVVADNVTAYRWQYSNTGANWSNSSYTGYNTDTLTVTIQDTRLYRCRITGKDGKYVYSDVVTVTKLS